MRAPLYIFLFSALSLLGAPAAELSPEARLAELVEEGLPQAPLLERIREGRAKQVGCEAIVGALDIRARHLRESRALLEQSGFAMRAPAVQPLWITAARVLEGGFPVPLLEERFALSQGQGAGRLISLLEAGEALWIAGMDEETVRMCLQLFYERNLTRIELLRASRSARSLFAEGHHGEAMLRHMEGHHSAGPHRAAEGRGGNGLHRRHFTRPARE